MTRALALAALTIGCVAICVAAFDERVANGLLPPAVVLLPVALIAMTVRRDRPALVWALAALLLLLEGATAALLWLAGAPVDPGPGGLPPATWLMFSGLGLVPWLLTTVVHAATFDDPGTGPG